MRGKDNPAHKAEYARRYRQEVIDGTRVPKPKPNMILDAIVLSDAERGEMESAWMVEYRRVVAGWLLKQRSQHTRRAYGRAWQQWIGWCEAHSIDPINPPHGTGAAWIAGKRVEGAAASTINQYRAAIRQVLVELTVGGLRNGGDPFALTRPERVGDMSTVLPITDDDVALMLATATRLGGKHRTAVLLLAVLGLRASEAGQVKQSTVRKSPWGIVADIVGKGSKRALVPLPKLVLDAAEIDGWPADGGRATTPYRRIQWLVDCIAREAGLHVSSHQFRHWHVTAAMEAGVPLEMVQRSVRHADPKTTMGYQFARRDQTNHTAHVIAKLPCITQEVG